MKKYTIYKGGIYPLIFKNDIYYIYDVYEQKYYVPENDILFDDLDIAQKYIEDNVNYNIGDYAYVEQNMYDAKKFIIEEIKDCVSSYSSPHKLYKLKCFDKEYWITITKLHMFKHKSWCLYNTLYKCLEDIKEIEHQKRSFEIIKNKVWQKLMEVGLKIKEK